MRGSQTMSEQKDVKQPPSEGLYRNSMSYFGGLITVGTAVLILFAIIGELTIIQPSPYVGIITYMVFPGIMFSGVVLVLWGMRREAVRRKKEGAAQQLPYPRLDLNDPRHRKRFAYGIVSGGVLLLVFAWVGYNGYLFTGSVTFCGKICHGVMKPEYTAYTHSAHARVPCVDCHVGSGASWFVQSKISGSRQVVATVFDTYDRPIKTPIAHLRPARETCEHCHWPEKFFGAALKQIPHYRYDEPNTPEQISLLLRTGGGNPARGSSAGIHWHMVMANKVTFAASDDKRQVIPWFKVEGIDGTERVYKAENTDLSDEQIAALPKRTMDCMDCHNRPSHAFPPPEGSVDHAMAVNEMPDDLPWIKQVAVDAVSTPYGTTEEARAGIRGAIEGFYREKYPQILETRKQDIDRAIAACQAIFDRSVFPEMNVNWTTYPNNIGHRHWPGCFRCHDDRHVANDGKRLSTSCTLCHTMPQRGARVPLGDVMPASDVDWHPWDMPSKTVAVEGHDRLLCHDCHAAGFRPRKTCVSCHK
jgi:nitrate/TMAO reductase-like tetraheme cytochrome c subunit